MPTDQEFTKYAESAAYHWHRTLDAPFFRKGLRLTARYDIPVNLLKKELQLSEARGVDVGCGDGVLVCKLAQTGASVLGLDASGEGVRQASSKLAARRVSAEVRRGSAYDLAVPTDSCDFVTAVELIEHLDFPGEFLAEAWRALKPGGVLVVTTPQRLPTQAPDEVRDPFHVKEYVRTELESELAATFRYVRVHGAYPSWLDRLYLRASRMDRVNQALRLAMRSAALPFGNPYVRAVSTPAEPHHQLLIGLARKLA